MKIKTTTCLLDELSHFKHCIADFIETSSSAASLKDAQTGRYLLANSIASGIHGIQDRDAMIGLTVDDFFQSSSGFFKVDFSHAFKCWKKEQPEKFKNLDYQVVNEKQRVESKNIQFTCDGLIFIERQIKIPVPSYSSKKIIAILTNSEDQTFQHGLSNLFELYRKYYPEKQAIQQTLKHLKIDQYFNEWPTLSEMWLLFALHRDVRQKCAANLLGLSTKTVHVYTNHLRSKLKTPDLHKVLAQLRALPIHEEYTQNLAVIRRLDGQDKRGRKLDRDKLKAAKALLADGVSPREVAGHIGISLSTLYRWIPDPSSLAKGSDVLNNRVLEEGQAQ